MSVLVPFVRKGITFNEVPDRMAVYFELGGCDAGCVGCHSPELSEDVQTLTNSDDLIRWAVDQIDAGANDIVVLGGTTSRQISEKDLIELLCYLSWIAPVCLYSGRDTVQNDIDVAVKGGCTWLKTGSYQADKGGLQSKTTNQKFYKIGTRFFVDKFDIVRSSTNYLVDMAHKFWK